MNWYYAKDGQQQGPVPDVEFQTLVAQGLIRPDTLVWREGFAAWIPWSTASASAAAVASAAPPRFGEASTGGVQCVECGQRFPADQVLNISGQSVCAGCKPVYVQRVREGVAGPSFLPGGQRALRYAGFWIRVGATIVDGIIITVVTLPIGLLVGGMGMIGFNPNNPSPELAPILLFQLGSIVLSMLYNWLFVAKYGATPGKMAVGIKIVNADGSPVTMGRAFGRFWAHLLSALVCYIGYIVAAFDEEKRAMHDHICSTRVIFK